MENVDQCTIAMLEGPSSQHVTGNTSWLKQPQSATSSYQANKWNAWSIATLPIEQK